jgi:hypothetical protein
MPQSIIRIYKTEAQANKAAAHLIGEGYSGVFQFNAPTSASAAARSNLVTEMMAAHILKSHAESYVDDLTKGKSLVMVRPIFGQAVNAINVLDSYAPVASGHPETKESVHFHWDEAAPLSSAFRLPILAKTEHPIETLTGISSLTKGKAFISHLLGMPLLKAGAARRETSMGFKMLSNSATPLSSAIGMRTLSQNATPLSSMFGLPVLTKRQ